MSCVTEKKKKTPKTQRESELKSFRMRFKNKNVSEADKAEVWKMERTSMWSRNYKRKKSGLIYSQPAKDLENLGAAVCVLLVSVDIFHL